VLAKRTDELHRFAASLPRTPLRGDTCRIPALRPCTGFRVMNRGRRQNMYLHTYARTYAYIFLYPPLLCDDFLRSVDLQKAQLLTDDQSRCPVVR
jgi:hypothetical protein